MPKFKLISFLFAFFIFGSSFTQSTLNGIVTIQNSGGKPAFPAQVKAFGATETTTKSNGNFHLVFGSKSPGDDAAIEVIKDGYEVVNKRDLFTRIPQSGNNNPLSIYMCPEGAWQKNAINFFGINEREITRKHEVKVAKLEKQLARKEIEVNKYEKDLSKLQKQKDKAINQANELAEKFAKANLDVESKRYIKAYKLFAEGKIDSVIIVLDNDKILREVEIAKNTLERATKEFILKADAYIVNLDWDNAEATYKLAIQTSPNHFDANLSFAQFLENQLRYREAITYYEKSKTLGLEQKIDRIQYSALLNDLARFYESFREEEKSRATFEEAIANWELIIKENPEDYFLKLFFSIGLINYGNLLNNDERNIVALNKSIKSYKRAIQLIQEYEANSDTILKSLGNPQIDIANCKNLISLSFKYQAELDSAEFYMKEAISMIDTTAAYRDQDLFTEAIIYMNYGNLLKWGVSLWAREFKHDGNLEDFVSKNNQMGVGLKDGNARSIPFYEKAIVVLEGLYEKNPLKYRFELARLYKNIAAAWEIEDIDKANPYYIKAIELYLELYEYDPNLYMTSMMSVLTNYSFQFFYPALLTSLEYSKLPAGTKPAADEIEQITEILDFCINRIIDINQLIYTLVIKYHPEICNTEKAANLKNQVIKMTPLKDAVANIYEKTESADILLLLVHLYEVMATIECDNTAKILLVKDAISYLEDYKIVSTEESLVKEDIGRLYGNLSWYLILDKQFKDAEKAALSGLEANPNAIWIKTNLAHSYLFQDKEKKAENTYLSLKNIPYVKDRSFTDVLLEDFELLKNEGVYHKGMDGMINKLKE